MGMAKKLVVGSDCFKEKIERSRKGEQEKDWRADLKKSRRRYDSTTILETFAYKLYTLTVIIFNQFIKLVRK